MESTPASGTDAGRDKVLLDGKLLGDGVHGILPPRQKKAKKNTTAKRERRHSKAEQKRRERQVAAAERKREQIRLLEQVAKSNLDTAQLRLLRPSARLGSGRDTRRDKVRREFARYRANLPPENPDDAELIFSETGKRAPSSDTDGGDNTDDGAENGTGEAAFSGFSGDRGERELTATSARQSSSATEEIPPRSADLHTYTSSAMSGTASDGVQTDEAKKMNDDGPQTADERVDKLMDSVAAASTPSQIVRTTRTRAKRPRGRMSTADARALLSRAAGKSKAAEDMATPLSRSSSEAADEDHEDQSEEADEDYGDQSEEADEDDKDQSEEADEDDKDQSEEADEDGEDQSEEDGESEPDYGEPASKKELRGALKGGKDGEDDTDGSPAVDDDEKLHEPRPDVVRQQLAPITVQSSTEAASHVHSAAKIPDDQKRARGATSPMELTKLVVRPNRPQKLAEERLKLPVCEKEHEVMEAIEESDVLVVTGETGSGKTTQVPQFLYEAGFGDPESSQNPGAVVITQPRRFAAMSCARRVADELGVKLGAEVGYQIRHSARRCEATKMLFVTDGVLLREMEDDLLLRKYSAIVVDEAHERSINTDLLLTLLSRSVVMRRQQTGTGPLKVIVMSATPTLEGFFAGERLLFPEHRLIQVQSRQYPVTMHFARRTSDDYLNEAYAKVCKIHRRLPSGGVLVFLTGKEEVENMCARLRSELADVYVLSLYALMPARAQRKIFDPPPAGRRKIVVATNVAETSITIPDVVYVVDTGRVKERVYELGGLVSSFEVQWISKASAKQRAGRAGRTAAGHCYRLYSSAVFENEFNEETTPEVCRVPVEALVLRLLSIGIQNVAQFPLPTGPPSDSLHRAELLLTHLGALDQLGNITAVGDGLALLPIPPRFAKMISAAVTMDCVRYAVRVAAALQVGELFASGSDQQNKLFYHNESDLLTMLRALCAAEHAVQRQGIKLEEFCSEYGLVERNVRECLSTAAQLDSLCEATFADYKESSKDVLRPPTRRETERIKQCILGAFPDHVARRITSAEAAERGITVRRGGVAFTTPSIDDDVVYLPRGSLRNQDAHYVCFSDVIQFKLGDDAEHRMRMCGVTICTRQWIAKWCSSLCTFGPALQSPEPFYDAKEGCVMCYVNATYGSAAYPLGTVAVEFNNGIRDQRVGASRYQVFASELVRGKVVSELGDLLRNTSGLKSSVERERLKTVAAMLATKRISSRKRLVEQWSRDKDFLVREIADLLPGADVAVLRRSWPPLQAALSPA